MTPALAALWPQIEMAARAHKLRPDLVAAVVLQESSANPHAWNPEPKYRWFWDVRQRKPFRTVSGVELAKKFPPKDFPTIAGDPDQEWWAQQASWGLMQVMGAVAREHGCRVPFLPELTDVDLNLEIGCRHLAGLMKWAEGRMDRALASYNGGRAGNAVPPYRNAEYAHKVFAKLATIRAARAATGETQHV